ncbi:MAG: choice-of-anchor D domain-containing protein, partial [Myxococcota bacterium]
MKKSIKYVSILFIMSILAYFFSHCGDTPISSIGGDSEVADILRYCKNSAQCNKDEECVNHRCVKKNNKLCRNKSDCNPDEECVEGRCVLIMDAETDTISDVPELLDTTYPDNEIKKAAIKAEPEQVDFGALRYGEKGEKSLVIKNVGDYVVKVFSISLEQGENKNVFSYSTTFANNTPLNPGELFEITISCVQDDADRDQGYLLISSDDPNMPLLRVLLFNSYKDAPDVKVIYIDSNNAQIEYPSAGDKNEINFDLGNVPIGEKKVQEFKIYNNAEYGILLLNSISIDPLNYNDKNANKFSVHLIDPISNGELSPPIYISGGEYIELIVDYDATKEATDDKFDVLVKFNDKDINNDGNKDEDGLLAFHLFSKAGYVPPKISVVDLNGVDILENGIDFGEVEKDTTERRFFKICNAGGGQLEVDSKSGLVNGNFSLSPEHPSGTLKYGQCISVELGFNPQFVGKVNDTMAIYSNDADNPQVSFPITATGVDTIIKVEPLSIDFGGVSVGIDATPYQVWIRNIGYGRLAINSIEMTSGSSSDFSLSNLPQNLPVYLNSGDSLSFYVGFKPSDIGNKEGSIEIKSSDKDNPTVVIVLKGSGSNCDPNHMDCNNDPIDGCETDITSSIEHCGGCNRLCAPANATAKCLNKSCIIESCNTDYENCNGDVSDGCEANLKSSITNCGYCNHNCGDNSLCDNGSCVCKSGYKDCDNNPDNGCETDILTDLSHCGDCNKRCSTDNTFLNKCDNGECKIVTCSLGFEDCDKIVSNGCEVDIRSNNDNCGACGNRCNQNATCKNSGCQCISGYSNCNGTWSDGCEVNINADVNNCGSCNKKCNLPNTSDVICDSGNCKIVKCATNFGNCDSNDLNGCESDLRTDSNNCGSCGSKCNNNASCINSSCQCDSGYLNCNNNWS